MFLRNYSCFIASAFVLITSPAASEQYSTSEVVKRFEAQISPPILTRSALATPRERRRGLVLVPATSGDALQTEEISFSVDPKNPINIRISFDINDSSLRADQRPKLTSVCEAMHILDNSAFQVIGHTDASGSAAHNDVLSISRAEAVKGYLIEECSIPETRLRAIGVGKRYLFDSTKPMAEINRRVEFQALITDDH